MKTTLGCLLLFPFLFGFSFAAALERRGPPETLYLTNCRNGGNAPGSPLTYFSQVEWYAAGHGSQNGEVSDDWCQVTRSGWQWWENGPVSCKFRSGVTVWANIASWGQSVPVGNWVGTASNGYRSFNCYKDSGRALYHFFDGYCSAIYYCVRLVIHVLIILLTITIHRFERHQEHV